MANPVADIERYIGGGTLYFSKWNGSTHETEIEIGEIKDASLKISASYADAFSKDDGFKKQVDKVLKEMNATIAFTTQNVSKENMAMAMFGELATETFAIGAVLPDGSVASAETILPVIKGGVVPKVEGKIRIVGANVSGPNNPVLQVHHAVLTSSGDVRNYFADDHASLPFDGEIMETNGEYFKEYFIPKA